MTTKKLTKVQEAAAYIQPLVDMVLKRGGRCMEQLMDRGFGIIAERWLLPNGVSVIVYGSRQYREVFIDIAPRTNSWDATAAALDAAAAIGSKS